METASGVRVDLLEPRIEQILIEDIAHHLAHENRYAGATVRPISVCEHSLYVMEAVAELSAPLGVQLGALLHDAQEAYVKDVPRPLKRLLGSVYSEIESRFANLIWSKFGCRNSPAIKDADNRVLLAEAQALMPNGSDRWGFREVPIPWVIQAVKLNSMVPARAHEQRFLRMFRVLSGAIAEETGSRGDGNTRGGCRG
jgi:hypothetical protein